MGLRVSLPVLLAALLLGACSGPSGTTDQGGPSPEDESDRPEGASAVAQYETFDASAYEVRLPEPETKIGHQVPSSLMKARENTGVRRTRQGFRIQVFSSVDKQAAQDFRSKVQQWWNNNKNQAPPSVFASEPPIDVVYSQPYYRVRIGAFVRRGPADKALQFIRETFKNAFIARSQVTVGQ